PRSRPPASRRRPAPSRFRWRASSPWRMTCSARAWNPATPEPVRPETGHGMRPLGVGFITLSPCLPPAPPHPPSTPVTERVADGRLGHRRPAGLLRRYPEVAGEVRL